MDQAAPHRFNEYLYERFETKDCNTPTKWHRVGAARLKASAGPVAETMEVEAQPTGVEKLRQTVVLYRDLKRIHFVLDLVKSPSGRTDRMSMDNPQFKESVFVAIPFAVPDFSFHHERPGGVSEPFKDLFDGACTAFYSVRHFSDVSNPRAGVTVSAPESALIEYGYPRSCPMGGPHGDHDFEKKKAPILNSRMHLYLMNNMFDTNVRWDQPGPVRFTYSIRSHSGDWKARRADEFGWDVQNPLTGKEISGTQTAGLPASRHTFMTIDKANVTCATLKPAEANGAGFILRFVETQGRETAAAVALPCLGRITSANESMRTRITVWLLWLAFCLVCLACRVMAELVRLGLVSRHGQEPLPGLTELLLPHRRCLLLFPMPWSIGALLLSVKEWLSADDMMLYAATIAVASALVAGVVGIICMLPFADLISILQTYALHEKESARGPARGQFSQTTIARSSEADSIVNCEN